MSNSTSKLTPRVTALEWKNDACYLLDQTKLPQSETYLRCENYMEVIDAIKRLAVRGAPLLGVAGAYSCVLAARQSEGKADPLPFILAAMKETEEARPTAVNLRWGVQRLKKLLESVDGNYFEVFLQEAKRIHEEDIECNRRMATFGTALFTKGAHVLTCCNTGDLATGGIGTAFGVFRNAFESGLVSHVYPVETRPVLQGLRLTTWELKKNGIPFTALCDNMAASLMKEGRITHVITGADRIAANGDSANKIGTYSLAVLAKHHNIPFYIAAPFSTFDLSLGSGKEIPIEQRQASEITDILEKGTTDIPCYNPSFDVTPADLISAIICDRGVITHPTTEKVRAMLAKPSRKPEERTCSV